MERVTAGESFSITYNVASAGEAYTAHVTDAAGRKMDSTVTNDGQNVTVSVNYQQWKDGQAGWGYVEIRREGTKAIVKRDRFRIMAGFEVGTAKDYA